MPITRKPASSNGVASSAKINRLINKGGSPSRAAASGKTVDLGAEIKVLLRIPERHLLDIDDLVAARTIKTSRHRWLMEAVTEKIHRERAGK